MEYVFEKDKGAWGETVIKCGKWTVFSFNYDSFVSKSQEGPRNKLTCRLPGIKEDLGYFDTWQEAEKKAQAVLDYWVRNLKAT